MNIGDLIKYKGELHIVVKIRPSIPNARAGQGTGVLLDTKQLETRTIPMKWIRNRK